ncbi:MAG TPA: PAS domain-containing protein [Synechococcales cyanobacterium M55_K2018_004]|nr:PAS domain-containing protein [Synechococcales cyanobacterium M55_K2018_004]
MPTAFWHRLWFPLLVTAGGIALVVLGEFVLLRSLDRSVVPVSEVLLGAGVGLSVLLGWAVYLMQAKQQQSRQLERINQDLAREIVERQQIEAELRDSQERWQLALEGNHDGLWDLDIRSNTVLRSPRFLEILGYAEGELDNSNEAWLSRLHPDDRERVLQVNADYLSRKIPFYEVEYRLRCKDGSYKWVLGRGQAVWDAQGNPIRMVGSLTDISERMRIQEERQQVEADLRLQNRRSQLFADITVRIRRSLKLETILQTTVTEIQHLLQTDRVVIFQLWPDGSGRVVQEAVVPGVEPLLHRDLVDPCFQEAYLDLYRQGRVSAVADIYTAPIQACYVEFLEQIQVRANLVVPILIRDQLWGLLIAHHCRDIRPWTEFETELLLQLANQVGIALAQSQLVEATRESEARFRTMADSAPVLLWLTDEEGNCTFVNQQWQQYTGLSLEESLGDGWLTAIHPDDQPEYRRRFFQVFRDRQPFQMEYRLRRVDGTFGWMLSSGLPRFLAEGNFAGYIGSCVDISDRREIEHLKDEFVSIVSHELRTPLTSISGALRLLASGVLQAQPERAQQMLNIAVSNTDRLVRLINDILDIERIESGKVTLNWQSCNAANLMNQAVEAMQSFADRSEVQLTVRSLAVSLWADPDRILQTLTNLLSNAIKFSHPGACVDLSAAVVFEKDSRLPKREPMASTDRAVPPGASEMPAPSGPMDSSRATDAMAVPPAYLRFAVRDQGRGIPPDKLETIFERFQQVDASDSRRKGGTGLGLAICRSIVQHHGGHIWAENNPSGGSTFYFTLPLTEETGPTNVHAAAGPLVLVCDDDDSVQTVLQAMLEQRGYRAIAVGSGREAIQQAIARHPNVILLNLMMPEMHGWQTLEQLKQHPQTQEIPVIILSGLQPSGQQTLPGGIVDWLVKPPTEDQLFASLERALNAQHAHPRVLVVEDDPDLAQVILTLFERHGIETSYARTGSDAIHLTQAISPSLLVLDLGLPDRDGFAVVDWLRQQNRLRWVPLVVYTARDLNDRERDRLKLGQTLFLTKGRITHEEFEQRVMDLLNRTVGQVPLD